MNNKREMLQTIVGVGTVVLCAPNSWIKPVVNSVVLPAHAQTSSVKIAVRRAFSHTDETVMGFSFVEHNGSVSHISSEFSEFPSLSDLTIKVTHTPIRGLDYTPTCVHIVSNYSNRFEVFCPSTTTQATISISYDDFVSTSGKVYLVIVKALHRISDGKAVVTVELQPR